VFIVVKVFRRQEDILILVDIMYLCYHNTAKITRIDVAQDRRCNLSAKIGT